MIFKKKQDAAAQQAAAGEARPAGKDKVAAFFRKNWKWMVPVACVAVLGGWFILRPDRAQDANVDVSYVQTTPEKRDLSNSLSGTGTLNPANTYNVKSLVAGKVLTSTIEEGDIVEIGTADEIYYDPRHPYTWALLSSMPQMGVKGEDLFNIVGTPPNLFAEIRGDAFAPRNPQALKIDFVKRPPYFEVTPTHKAKTWLLDPRAPKIEPPAAVKMLREEGL